MARACSAPLTCLLPAAAVLRRAAWLAASVKSLFAPPFSGGDRQQPVGAACAAAFCSFRLSSLGGAKRPLKRRAIWTAAATIQNSAGRCLQASIAHCLCTQKNKARLCPWRFLLKRGKSSGLDWLKACHDSIFLSGFKDQKPEFISSIKKNWSPTSF